MVRVLVRAGSPGNAAAGLVLLTLIATSLLACSSSGGANGRTPGDELERGVRTMTGSIPRARGAAADLNQRSAESAAAANGIQ